MNYPSKFNSVSNFRPPTELPMHYHIAVYVKLTYPALDFVQEMKARDHVGMEQLFQTEVYAGGYVKERELNQFYLYNDGVVLAESLEQLKKRLAAAADSVIEKYPFIFLNFRVTNVDSAAPIFEVYAQENRPVEVVSHAS